MGPGTLLGIVTADRILARLFPFAAGGARGAPIGIDAGHHAGTAQVGARTVRALGCFTDAPGVVARARGVG